MKRKLFNEISEGFDALTQARRGKRTLRTHDVEISTTQRGPKGAGHSMAGKASAAVKGFKR